MSITFQIPVHFKTSLGCSKRAGLFQPQRHGKYLWLNTSGVGSLLLPIVAIKTTFLKLSVFLPKPSNYKTSDLDCCLNTQPINQSSACDTQMCCYCPLSAGNGGLKPRHCRWHLVWFLEHCLIVATSSFCCDSVVFRILWGAVVWRQGELHHGPL